jgi:hypothetical protein
LLAKHVLLSCVRPASWLLKARKFEVSPRFLACQTMIVRRGKIQLNGENLTVIITAFYYPTRSRDSPKSESKQSHAPQRRH